MIHLSELPLYLLLPTVFLAGLLLGYAYFHSLRTTTALIVSQGHPLIALGLTMSRLALLAVIFYAAARAGGPALLAALAGVLCARTLMLHRLQSQGKRQDKRQDK